MTVDPASTAPDAPLDPPDRTAPAAGWGVVLVHGVRTSATMWRHQVAALEAAGHAVVAVDLPGHGTRMAETFTLDAACATVEQAVQGLRASGARRIAVVGLSLGGYLTLRWAARTATPPDALVVSSCTARPGGLGNRGFVGITHAFRSLPGDGAARVSEPWARAFVGAAGADDIVRGGVSVDGQLAALRAMVEATPLEDLRVVVGRGIPVTFVTGEWDHFRLDEAAFRRAGREAAGSSGTRPPRWVLVRRAHHLVSLHRPRAYTRALLDTLARAERLVAPTSDLTAPVADPAWDRVRTDYAEAVAWWLDVVARVGDRWADPGLGEWDVRALVGHTSRSLVTVEEYLAAPADAIAVADAPGYVEATRAMLGGPGVTERGIAAGAALGGEPEAALRELAARVLGLVDARTGAEPVTTLAGGMRLVDYLPTRTLELVVHGCDLATVLGLDARPPTGPASATLTTLATLAVRGDRSAPVILALTGRDPLPPGFTLL